MEKEFISAFYAQYYGQRVCYVKGPEYITAAGDVTANTLNNPDPYILSLTSLADITDEDAIEVAYILGRDQLPLHHGKLFIKRLLGERFGNASDNCYLSYTTIWCADYLRSKGYALPYRGYSVQELIEAGLIVLKT